MRPSPWRTVLFLGWLANVYLVGLLIIAGMPEGLGREVSGSLSWVILGLGFAAAGKSFGEHAVKGSGLRGALSALLTDAKPGEAAAAAPPPQQPPAAPAA